LNPHLGYKVEEFRAAVGCLPLEGLEEVAHALVQALESAADQREEYWKNRVHPFWQDIWPKSRDLVTSRIAETLTRLVVATQGQFPEALAAVHVWLKPIEHPGFVVHLLHKAGLCSQFPSDALQLLDAIIEDQHWPPQELALCLDQIVQAAQNFDQDNRYIQLREYSRKRGA
jgi:hypothetical protein